MAKKVSADSSEMREFAARICRDYLHGPWKQVDEESIRLKRISGGLSNLLYHVALPKALCDEAGGQPKEVLMRVYGQTHGESALEALITESVVFTLLSERGLGPKLHGIFPGGRIEQYINARPLLTSELADARLSVKIAKKMAAIHAMEVPLHKEPGWLWETIERWLKTCDKLQNCEIGMPDFLRKTLSNLNDLRGEAKWLKERLEKENCPVVFCHNDMQEGNILIKRDGNENNNNEAHIVVIDFEYCSYNYRSFDLANHFIEWIYDYTSEEHPFYFENVSNYPTKEQRLLFIRTYLAERGLRESATKILREVEVFTLASHLFWGIWGIINANTSQIPFGYWEYANSRLGHYIDLKKRVAMPAKRKSCNLE